MGVICKAMMQQTIMQIVLNETDEETISLLYSTIKDIVVPMNVSPLHGRKNAIRKRLNVATDEEVTAIENALRK